MPGFITLTSTIFPSLITGLNSAPEPNLSLPLTSLTIKSGIEVYSFPPNSIFTFVSSVPITIGFNSAFLPLFTFIFGFFSKFNIVEP